MERHSEREEKKISLGRRLIGDILILVIIVMTAHLSYVMVNKIREVVLKAIYQRFFRQELILCGVLLLFALDVRFGLLTQMRPKFCKVIGWILRIATVCATAVILFLCGRVTASGFIKSNASADKALVLGMALQNGQPTDDLVSRVDTAKDYLAAHPDAELILTGGNPDDSGRTEAAVMRELLLERGVPDDKMYLEDQAASTVQNFENTAKMLDVHAPVALITSNYHMQRSVRTAKEAGFENVLRVPAPSDLKLWDVNMLWEVVSDLNTWMPRKHFGHGQKPGAAAS